MLYENGEFERIRPHLTPLECGIIFDGIPEGAISREVGLIWGIPVYSGREAYAQDHGGVWSRGGGLDRAGLHASCLPFIRDNDMSILCWDMMDSLPNEYGIPWTVHGAIFAYGVALLDNSLLQPLAEACTEEGRYDFMLTINPLNVVGGDRLPRQPRRRVLGTRPTRSLPSPWNPITTLTAAPRPLARFSVTKTYEGTHQQYDVVCDSNVMVPTRDGVGLATDVYFPAMGGRRTEGTFPVILERTPYDKSTPLNVTNAKYFARRGYVCAIQDVRGRFESEGEWYAFAREAPDGYDAVEWVGTQHWSNGKVGTMGPSYGGSDQSALATMDPPHLATMIVANGASNYYHSSMRQNGAAELRFQMWVYAMAATSKEARADPALKAALTRIFAEDMPDVAKQLPLSEGTTILRRLPSYERWAIDILTRGDYDDYWKQRGYAMSEYYEEHADVPSLYIGSWYDSYARNTCESFAKLSKLKRSPQRLLMGPWIHGGWGQTFAGDVDFGTDSHIDYNDMRLTWFDHYLKGLYTEVADWPPVRIFTMGTGDGRPNNDGRTQQGGHWRDVPDWPPPATELTPYYLQGDHSLSPEVPQKRVFPPSTFTFDPMNPVPTIGGGISAAYIMQPGAFDQRGRPDFIGCTDTEPLGSRSDILVFQTPPLAQDMEVTGPIEMHLWASSSAVDTDFTAKLIDVHPPSPDDAEGLAINITDSIIRARYRNGWLKPEFMTPGEPYEFVFQLYPTSNIFRRGHRIRLDISSSNWPRFDVNLNTGGPLGRRGSYQAAAQTVYHDADCPSHVVLPLQGR